MLILLCRELVQQQAATAAKHERQAALAHDQFISRETQLQNDLIQAQTAAQSQIERVQLRAEADGADYKASINRLEVDLIKVSFPWWN